MHSTVEETILVSGVKLVCGQHCRTTVIVCTVWILGMRSNFEAEARELERVLVRSADATRGFCKDLGAADLRLRRANLSILLKLFVSPGWF